MITASRWRGGARWRLPASRWWAPALAVLLVLAASLRARLGIDFGDSSHAVALAMRLSQGDVPFRDEMNLQVLGSWPAVPFVWTWLHVVGIDGVVLASRIWFVVFSAACGYVAWRALAPLLGRGTTAAAVAIALVPTAYNQQVLSYNTTPALMYLVAAGAGVAAVAGRSMGWGLVAGAASALGATSHPVTVPAAFALLLVVLVRARGRAVVGVLVGAGAVAVVVAALALLVWRPTAISDTLTFTEAYQASRPGLDERFERWTSYLAAALASPLVVVSLVLAALCAVPAVLALRRTRAWLLVPAVALVVVHAFNQPAVGASAPVWFSGVLATVLIVPLLPVAVVCAVRRPGALALLVPVGLAPTLVGLPVVAAFTSSSPMWGATSAVLAPGLLAVVLASLLWVGRAGTWPKLVLAGVLLTSLGLVHTLNSFRDVPPDRLAAAPSSGPFAGVLTTEDRRDEVEQARLALTQCAAPGDGVLAYHFPAAFLFADVRFDTPIVWTIAGPSTERVLRWIDATGRAPDCVVAARAYWPGYGSNPTLRLPDPLRDWVVANYRVVSQTSLVVVLRRDG